MFIGHCKTDQKLTLSNNEQYLMVLIARLLYSYAKFEFVYFIPERAIK